MKNSNSIISIRLSRFLSFCLIALIIQIPLIGHSKSYSATSFLVSEGNYIEVNDYGINKTEVTAEDADAYDVRLRNIIIVYVSLLSSVLLCCLLVIARRYRHSKIVNLIVENEKFHLILDKEHLEKEKRKIELENSDNKVRNEELPKEKEALAGEHVKSEAELQRQTMISDELQQRINDLEDESIQLKSILADRYKLSESVETAIRSRIELLNGLLASDITGNDKLVKRFNNLKEKLINDPEAFMNSTRLAFKASHPAFIDYLEKHELTEDELNYSCLYAIGLNGKEIGLYIRQSRHYHMSSDIRKKLGLKENNTNLGIYLRNLLSNPIHNEI